MPCGTKTKQKRLLSGSRVRSTRHGKKKRDIEPTYRDKPKPHKLEVLKLLLNTKCGEWLEPMCMVFALRVVKGVKSPENCPGIDKEKALTLWEYLNRFELDA